MDWSKRSRLLRSSAMAADSLRVSAKLPKPSEGVWLISHLQLLLGLDHRRDLLRELEGLRQ
eukprot:1135694-Alexandrium_andersonii.AAC.1